MTDTPELPPTVTEFNVGHWCLSEDDCIAQGIDFAAYERGVSDAAEAFARNRATRLAAVPQGWKLVPMKPTTRQMAAMGPAIRACYALDGVSGVVSDVYRAALDAAPAASSPEAAQSGPTNAVARVIYEQWKDVPGWVPWVEGGNSFKQDDARRLARAALASAPAGAGEGERFERAIAKVENKLRGIPQAHMAAQVIEELRAALAGEPAGAAPDRCAHGVRFPHECRECADSYTDEEIRMWQAGEPAIAADEGRQEAPSADVWTPLPYATPMELWRAFKDGAKFILHYHGRTFNVTNMQLREKVVYVQPPGMPVKVFPDGRSAEGTSPAIWLRAASQDEQQEKQK